MKIYFFETEPWEQSFLKKHLKGASPVFVAEKLSAKNASTFKSAELISTFIGSDCSARVMNLLPKLSFIAIRATGFDHVDLAHAKKRKIVVSNVPAYGTTTVAEHALALMLAVSRNIFQSFERTEKFNFDVHGLTGFDLEGKTLGLVGFGKIARHVARLARGFGMNIVAYDTFQDTTSARELGVKFVPLNSLLKSSDVISFHAPYTKTTHHLLNMKNVNLVKKGAIVVNTARGALIDTKALLYGLENKIFSGAGLDVLEGEQEIREEKELLVGSRKRFKEYQILLEDHLLVERDDVIITPHNAFNSREALDRIMKTTVENIQAFVKGKPINVVSQKS